MRRAVARRERAQNAERRCARRSAVRKEDKEQGCDSSADRQVHSQESGESTYFETRSLGGRLPRAYVMTDFAWHGIPIAAINSLRTFRDASPPFGIFRAMRASVALFAPALAKERKGARGTFAFARSGPAFYLAIAASFPFRGATRQLEPGRGRPP